MTIDVSVIIAAYNVERYLAQAVTSALAQEQVTVELIIIDDASTDGTWDMLEQLTDPRIRKIRQPANTGPGAARNAGLAIAQGTWIAILDGDDQFLPGRLARCIARAATSQADIVVDNLLVHQEADGSEQPMFSSAIFARTPQLALHDWIHERLDPKSHHTLGYLKPLFRREAMAAHTLRYRTDLPIGEDHRLMADALATGLRCVVELSLGYRYTVRQGSISHRLSTENLARIMVSDADFLATHPHLSPQALRAMRIRTARHHDYHAYLQLVAAIKTRDIGAIATILLRRPLAARHLSEPLMKRLRARA